MFSTALMATTSTPIEKNDKAVNSFPTAKTVKKPDCTVTRSATRTAYGMDSNGNTYICEATATQTATAATCSEASAEAYGQASMWALIMLQGFKVL